jgi:phage-related holin
MILQRLCSWSRTLGALAAALWGSLPVMVQVLIGLMVLDIVAGLLVATMSQSLSSRLSFRGMARKGMVLIMVAAALSLIENAALAGLPVPDALRAALARVPGADRTPEPPGGQA